MVRGSLGSIKLLGDGAVRHRYPMYAISVGNLLKLDNWLPHQDLLKNGLLTEIKTSMDVEVLFISHQASALRTAAIANATCIHAAP